MLIANPIYDVVFKYLMKDKKVAKLLLSAIIGEEIIEIDFRPIEQEVNVKDSWTVIRMDFSAKIKSRAEAEKLVIIEIQKAKLPTDIMRFRQYLGEQYIDENNTIEVDSKRDGKKRKKALPIISIYFLGHPLEHTDIPVIKVARKYYDVSNNEEILNKEEFIESLTHDSFVVQIPSLTGRRRTELEAMLSVFDQENRTKDKHILNYKEEDLPEKYRPILRRLIAAISERKIRNTMRAEDHFIEDFKELERENAKQKEYIKEKERALEEQNRVLEEQKKLIDELKNQLKNKP